MAQAHGPLERPNHFADDREQLARASSQGVIPVGRWWVDVCRGVDGHVGGAPHRGMAICTGLVVAEAKPRDNGLQLNEVFSPGIRALLKGAAGTAGQGCGESLATSITAPRHELPPGGTRFSAGASV
jgi:hypothetical protein